MIIIGLVVSAILPGCNKDKDEDESPQKVDSLVLLRTGDLPVFSPDGSKIAFVSNDTLYTMNPDGSAVKMISKGIFNGYPRWSNSGEYLLYTGTYANIFKVKNDGTGLVNLTNDNFACSVPVWSPDDQFIAFVSLGTTGDLYIMNSDGTGIRKITDLQSCDPIQNPQWNSDGSEIIFSAGWDVDLDLYSIRTDGSGLRRFNYPDLLETRAQIDSDHSLIYFTALKNSESLIYKVNLDGTGLTNLTGPTGFDMNALLSPGGSYITFIGARGGRSGLHIMKADGSAAKWLHSVDVYAVNWSYDEKYLCYVLANNGVLEIWKFIVPAV